MRATGLCALCFILLAWTANVPADVPPIAQEMLTQFETERAELQKKTEAEMAKTREKFMAGLKKMQDDATKEARMDEALALRETIRLLREEWNDALPVRDLPRAARKVVREYEDEMTAIRRQHEDDADKVEDKILAELKKMQDIFCKEGKLDEAVAVRDLARGLRGGNVTGAAVLPDPGYVNNPVADIGKVFYYEVTGNTTGGSIYGTDLYTTGSFLAMAAVHSGVLKNGQRGVVKVTILAGRDSYPASMKNDITSSQYSTWGVSFKVERGFGFSARALAVPMPK